jgi:hypothetical protein
VSGSVLIRDVFFSCFIIDGARIRPLYLIYYEKLQNIPKTPGEYAGNAKSSTANTILHALNCTPQTQFVLGFRAKNGAEGLNGKTLRWQLATVGIMYVLSRER